MARETNGQMCMRAAFRVDFGLTANGREANKSIDRQHAVMWQWLACDDGDVVHQGACGMQGKVTTTSRSPAVRACTRSQ